MASAQKRGPDLAWRTPTSNVLFVAESGGEKRPEGRGFRLRSAAALPIFQGWSLLRKQAAQILDGASAASRGESTSSDPGVRVILENSTVCQIVDELVCFALSSVWVMVLTFDSGNVFVRFSCRADSFSPHGFFGLCGGVVFNGEFDPGSGRTLAACLTHASRAERPFGVLERRTGE